MEMNMNDEIGREALLGTGGQLEWMARLFGRVGREMKSSSKVFRHSH